MWLLKSWHLKVKLFVLERGDFRVKPLKFWLQKVKLARWKGCDLFVAMRKQRKMFASRVVLKRKDGNLKRLEFQEMSGWWQFAWLCLIFFSGSYWASFSFKRFVFESGWFECIQEKLERFSFGLKPLRSM